MFQLAVLILLTLFLKFRLSRLFNERLTRDKRRECERLEGDCLNTQGQINVLKAANADLESSAEKTVALYHLTKDMSRTLDEESIFVVFRERINNHVAVGDCRLLKAGSDMSAYKEYLVLPLIIHKNAVRYLVASGIKENERDRFNILAQQFFLGLKRALLYKEVQELSVTDSLTQTFSRRYFLERLREELERANKFKLKFSFLMLDYDHFKECNDHFGHLVGDAVLRETAKEVKLNIRQVDFLGRYGGEELALVLTDTDKKQAVVVAERIRQAIESKSIRVYDEVLKITISIGIATFPEDAQNSQALIDKADTALYAAKQSGRNRVCVS